MSPTRSKILATVLLLLANGPVRAVTMGAGRFDQLIKNAEIVVKGRVTGVDKSRFEMIAFTAEVVTVLKSDGGAIPDEVYVEAPAPIWPEDLGIPFAKNQVVLVVLKRAKGKIAAVNNVRAILPATNNRIHHEDSSSIARKVCEELKAYLYQTNDEVAKGLVLVLLCQFVSEKDDEIFLPYIKSANKWLGRAARASLLRLKPTPERISEAVDDFANHLSAVSQDILFWEMYKDVQWSARCGSFGMEKDLTDRAVAYLPIYRVLIDKSPSNYQHIYVAIEALKNVGTREDIRRLYKYVDHSKAWIRHDVLEGLGRILGMKMKRPWITSYEMPLPPDVEPWEEKTRSIIERILVDEGLLEK